MKAQTIECFFGLIQYTASIRNTIGGRTCSQPGSDRSKTSVSSERLKCGIKQVRMM